MGTRNSRSPPLYAGRGSHPMEGNEIDHNIVSKRFCLTDVAVVPKFYKGRLLGRLNNIDEEYDRLVEYLHDCTKKAESFKTTKRRLSLETLELVRQRGTAPAAENQKLTSELAMLCREAIKEDLKERKAKRWLKLQRREKCPSRLRQSQDEDDCSPKLEGNNHCIKKGKGENLLRLLL
ncbi:hypothetical protein RB195_010190 [Necator americanus]|uniref:Uncharacterized protein n=1 Tax=Necator americanus TaxID=51031 RepID=A0ABR1CWT6_NECAM